MDNKLRISILNDVLPDETFMVGKKNLKKMLQSQDIKVNMSEGGANAGYVEAILIMIQAVAFLDSAINIYHNIFKKEPKEIKEEKILNIIINENNSKVDQLTESQLESIASKVMERLKKTIIESDSNE